MMHEVKCPYCGGINDNLWEWESAQLECCEEKECDCCGKTFMLTRDTEVTYTADKI